MLPNEMEKADRMDTPALLETDDTTRKAKRFPLLASALLVLLSIAAAGMYTWVFVIDPCKVDAVKEASTILVTQLKTYDGVYQVAATASRTSPDHPVNTLKQIFMDTQEVTVPACMKTAKNELIDYMGAVISAFQAYRAEESDATVRAFLRQSDKHYDKFSFELDAVNKCAPFCIP